MTVHGRIFLRPTLSREHGARSMEHRHPTSDLRHFISRQVLLNNEKQVVCHRLSCHLHPDRFCDNCFFYYGFVQVLPCYGIWVVPTKQCRLIISGSYISQLLAARGVKSGIYKAIQGGISKPALLCMDYRIMELRN